MGNYYKIPQGIYELYGFDNQQITPEILARVAPFTDPLNLNFKFMVNWDKPYGLFADEKHTDSALAYLKRIGEEERYILLKTFITRFKELIINYEFLFIGIDGLGEIFGMKSTHIPTDDDKIILTLRETIDMRIQALIVMYRKIMRSTKRLVEILPANLRRFDAYIVVYSSGYYSALLYDSYVNGRDNDPDNFVLPTINKLNKLNLTDIPFTNVMFYLYDCSIVTEDSGKQFFDNITNEQNSDIVKNQIVLKYRFHNYDAKFPNLVGDFNIGDFTSIAALKSKLVKTLDYDSKLTLNEFFSDDFNYNNKTEKIRKPYLDEIKKITKDKIKSTYKGYETRTINYGKNYISKSTHVGNVIDIIKTPQRLIDYIIDGADRYINDYYRKGIDILNGGQNFISTNFNSTILNVNDFGKPLKTNIEYQENIKPR